MGDMADFTLEHAALDYYPDFASARNRKKYWRTQFGEWVKITDMTTQHLENTCAMLERNDAQAHPSYFALVEELEKRNAARSYYDKIENCCQPAKGKYLDRLGKTRFGTKRREFLIWKESDEEYKERLSKAHLRHCKKNEGEN